MNIVDVLVVLVIAAIVLSIVLWKVKKVKKGQTTGCGCGCENCAGGCGLHMKEKN